MTYTLTKEQLLSLIKDVYDDGIHDATTVAYVTKDEVTGLPIPSLNSFLPSVYWEEGPIPAPTELCTLVLETATLPEAHTSYQYELNGYKYCRWNGIGGLKLERYIFDDPRNMKFTGRWYIQPITVPTE